MALSSVVQSTKHCTIFVQFLLKFYPAGQKKDFDSREGGLSGIMLLSAGLEAGLELGEVALVSLVEMGPRHEQRGVELALSHILHSGGKVVVVAAEPRSFPHSP